MQARDSVLVGPPGSGKTLLLRAAFPERLAVPAGPAAGQLQGALLSARPDRGR